MPKKNHYYMASVNTVLFVIKDPFLGPGVDCCWSEKKVVLARELVGDGCFLPSHLTSFADFLEVNDQQGQKGQSHEDEQSQDDVKGQILEPLLLSRKVPF